MLQLLDRHNRDCAAIAERLGSAGARVYLAGRSTAPMEESRVRIVVASSDPLEDTVVKTATGLGWRLMAKGVKTEQVTLIQQAAPASNETTIYVDRGAPKQRRYTGRRVTFEFKDIDIHNLLRVIAEVSKKNASRRRMLPITRS